MPDENGVSPDFWNNLMQFGFATMQAGGQPGATTLGAIGQGGLAATQQARQLQALRAQTGLQQAQAQYYGAQTAKDIVPLQIQLQQMRMYRQAYGQPTDDIDAMMQRLTGATGMSMPNAYGGPSGGGAGAPSSAPLADGGTTAGMPHVSSAGAAAPQSTRAELAGGAASAPALDMGHLQRIALGTVAPTNRAEAYQAAGFALHVMGDPKTAEALQNYALKLPEGMELTGSGAIQNTAGLAQGKAQVAAAEGWGKAGPEAWVQAMHPTDLRGPGSTYINPYLRQIIQVPNEITEVDPRTLAENKRFVPLGLSVTGQGPLSFAAGGAPSAGSSPNLPPGRGAGAGFGPPVTPSQAGGAQTAIPPTGGETGFMTKAPPGQEEIVKGLAKNYNEEGKKAYEGAVASLGHLEFMDRNLDTMAAGGGFATPGSGVDFRVGLAKDINSWQQTLGMQPSFDTNKVATWEDFNKETRLAGMTVVNQMFGGSREAASIINGAVNAVPSASNSYLGGKLVLNGIKESSQREVDLRNYETNKIATTGGNLTGIREEFNQQYPTQMYTRRAISKIQPYDVTGLSEADVRKRYLPGTVITMGGKVKALSGPMGVPLATQEAQ